jgi:hypothetical protein
MIYKGVLCILLCWFCQSNIKLFQSYNSRPIPYVIVCRSSLSNKPYTSLIKLHYVITSVVIHVTCIHWRQYKTTRCKILQKDFQSSQHVVQCNVPPPPHPPHTQHEAGGSDIRAFTSKCSAGSKASVSFPNDSFLPLHRSLCFMVARASVAQEGLSSVVIGRKVA